MSKRREKAILIAWLSSLFVWMAVGSALELAGSPPFPQTLAAAIPLLGALPAVVTLWQQTREGAGCADE